MPTTSSMRRSQEHAKETTRARSWSARGTQTYFAAFIAKDSMFRAIYFILRNNRTPEEFSGTVQPFIYILRIMHVNDCCSLLRPAPEPTRRPGDWPPGPMSREFSLKSQTSNVMASEPSPVSSHRLAERGCPAGRSQSQEAMPT